MVKERWKGGKREKNTGVGREWLSVENRGLVWKEKGWREMEGGGREGQGKILMKRKRGVWRDMDEKKEEYGEMWRGRERGVWRDMEGKRERSMERYGDGEKEEYRDIWMKKKRMVWRGMDEERKKKIDMDEKERGVGWKEGKEKDKA